MRWLRHRSRNENSEQDTHMSVGKLKLENLETRASRIDTDMSANGHVKYELARVGHNQNKHYYISALRTWWICYNNDSLALYLFIFNLSMLASIFSKYLLIRVTSPAFLGWRISLTVLYSLSNSWCWWRISRCARHENRECSSSSITIQIKHFRSLLGGFGL